MLVIRSRISLFPGIRLEVNDTILTVHVYDGVHMPRPFGDTVLQDIERLVGALADIERLYKKDSTGMLSGEYIAPNSCASYRYRCAQPSRSLQWINSLPLSVIASGRVSIEVFRRSSMIAFTESSRSYTNRYPPVSYPADTGQIEGLVISQPDRVPSESRTLLIRLGG